MNMSRPHAVIGRKRHGRTPKNRATNHTRTPVRMTNPMHVMRKGGRGKKSR
jgi:hypothetical protein